MASFHRSLSVGKINQTSPKSEAIGMIDVQLFDNNVIEPNFFLFRNKKPVFHTPVELLIDRKHLSMGGKIDRA